jgi:hypothetical protein
METLRSKIRDLPAEIKREILCEILSEKTIPVIFSLFDNVNSIKRCPRFKDLDWGLISKSELSEDFISAFQDRVNWTLVSKKSKLSEKFISRFSDRVDWDYISSNQTLSESFISKHKNDVNWIFISGGQVLSEEFIRSFKDRVNWTLISKTQNLSDSFISEFSSYLDQFYVARNRRNTSVIQE